MPKKRPVQWSSARDIADAATMSVKFLEQILGELRSAGIVKSRRGAHGGHALAMAPDEVALAKVIRLMDGPIAPLACVSLNYYERCEDCKEEECGLRRVMVRVQGCPIVHFGAPLSQGPDLNPTMLIGIVCERLILQA